MNSYGGKYDTEQSHFGDTEGINGGLVTFFET